MIEKLTAEQEAQIEVYREKWLGIGLSTERIDQEKGVQIINDLYTKVLNKPTVPVVFAKSPIDAWEQVKGHTGNEGEDLEFVWPYLDGNFFSSILAFYDYFLNCVGVELDSDELYEKFEVWKATSELGLIYPLDDVCIVSEKATEIHMVDGKLHNPDGASIIFEDGFKVYSLNGIRVPEWVVTTPADQIPVKSILSEKNVEIRRELVRKVGMERIYKDSKSTIIDRQGSYDLVDIPLGDGLVGRYLKMVNPSIDTIHLEGVPSECDSVDKALAWRNHEWEVGEEFNSYTVPEILT